MCLFLYTKRRRRHFAVATLPRPHNLQVKSRLLPSSCSAAREEEPPPRKPFSESTGGGGRGIEAIESFNRQTAGPSTVIHKSLY
jgi:hypothetical protein